MIHLKEITENNYRASFKLKVSDNQKHFVATIPVALSRAYVYRDTAEPLLIYKDEKMIGFVLVRGYEDTFCIDQFMIDETYQGNGYGKEAMKQIVNRLKAKGTYNKVILCYCSGNTHARDLFKQVGFKHTGKYDDDEIIMELTFK